MPALSLPYPLSLCPPRLFDHLRILFVTFPNKISALVAPDVRHSKGIVMAEKHNPKKAAQRLTELGRPTEETTELDPIRGTKGR